jgi:hypothetical protein
MPVTTHSTSAIATRHDRRINTSGRRSVSQKRPSEFGVRLMAVVREGRRRGEAKDMGNAELGMLKYECLIS